MTSAPGRNDPLDNRSLQRIIWAVLLAASLYGLYQAISQAWISDDLFISLRYARNFVEGHGLVFNVGERVEGYTNFLWTILSACALAVGWEPVSFCHTLGILSFLASANFLLAVSVAVSRTSDARKRLVLPVAAIALLLHHDFQVHASSGLETVFVAALVTAAFYIATTRTTTCSALYAGLVLVAAALTRPDALLFYVAAVPYYALVYRRKCLPYLIRLLGPLLVIYLPYWLLRYDYYGYPFPNTYYAKSGGLAYYSQGFKYLFFYLKTYYIFWLLLPAMLAMAISLATRMLKSSPAWGVTGRIGLLSILMILPYVWYVVRVGGDFMFARFFLPVTPIALILLETTLLSLARKRSIQITFCLVIAASVFFRWNQFSQARPLIDGIADEPLFYTESLVKQGRREGLILKRYLSHLDVSAGFDGTKAIVIYYSEIPTAIECITGLTDEYIAHLPLDRRGRPGHEKQAPVEYLVERGVNFMFTTFPPEQNAESQLKMISIAGVPAAVVTYQNDVMNALKEHREVSFVDFPTFLDGIIRQGASIPREELARDYEFFKEYYFDHNDDPVRKKALEDLIAGVPVDYP